MIARRNLAVSNANVTELKEAFAKFDTSSDSEDFRIQRMFVQRWCRPDLRTARPTSCTPCHDPLRRLQRTRAA